MDTFNNTTTTIQPYPEEYKKKIDKLKTYSIDELTSLRTNLENYISTQITSSTSTNMIHPQLLNKQIELGFINQVLLEKQNAISKEQEEFKILYEHLYKEIEKNLKFFYHIIQNTEESDKQFLDPYKLSYLLAKKELNNNDLYKIAQQLLLYTYRSDINEIKNHNEINKELKEIKELLEKYVKKESEQTPPAAPPA